MGGGQCISNLPWMTDHLDSREPELKVDIDSGGTTSEEDETHDIVSANNQGRKVLNTVWSGPLSFDALTNSSKFSDIADENVELFIDKSLEGEKQQAAFVNKKLVEEKQKKTKNSRKAPKPPRPPKGPSLDAADQKLVQEITELAMRKRARIERIKMLKKMKTARSSWNSSLCAMVITILFCIIIVFQGICARSSRNMYLQGSPEPAVAANEDLITIEFYKNSAYKSDGPGSGSPNLAEGQVSGSRKK